MKAFETKISELNKEQKSHLAWRLEHYAHVSLASVAKGDDLTLFEVFEKAGMNPQQAKNHSSKVCNFNTSTLGKLQIK